jgi:uncharacterized protein (TIGR04141 family)
LTSEKKHKLSVFLIKQGYQTTQEFISSEIKHSVTIPLTTDITATLFFSPGHAEPPSWAKIFSGIPEFDKAKILNQHSKALLVFKSNDRWFCFTFGYAKHIINQGTYERNFGLLVALNLSDPTSFKSIDKTNISINPIQSRNQASKEIEIESMGFNNDIDILKSITARVQKTNVDDENQTLSGRDSVSISSAVELTTFPEIANHLFKAFSSNDYVEKYPWFDKVVQERDQAIIQKLDQLLVSKIKENETEEIWLAIPEIIDWDNTQGFTYKRYTQTNNTKKPGPVIVQDIDIENWVKEIDVQNLTLDTLYNKNIFIIDNDSHITSSINIYRCLNAELIIDNKTYILNDGDWYNINTNFENEVNSFYNNIKDSALKLPPYGSMKEPDYLKHVVAQNNSLCLMDRKLINYSGHSKIEFCDLYSSTKQIVHIKKYSGSSVLSHLFSQAVVSAQCFMFDSTFREKVNKNLDKAFQLADIEAPPITSNFEVCIAIMSSRAGSLHLPFFSKVNLRNAVVLLSNFGYKVTKLKINR